MRGRVSKSCSRLNLSQEEQLGAVASKRAEPPPSRDRSPVGGNLTQGTTPSQSGKPQLDIAPASNSLPQKRTRLTRTYTQARPSRRSPRLQTRYSADSEGPNRTAQPAPLCELQTEAGAGGVLSPSKRAGLSQTCTQQSGVDHEEEAAKIVQPKPAKRPYTSVKGQEQAFPATLLRKRQVDSDGNDNEHQLKRARLTRENLALFDKMAKKKGANKASTSALRSTVESSITSTTTSGFAIQAYKNGILNPLSSKPPANLKDIRKRLAGSRATASPPESVYEDYVDTIGGAVNEATMVVEVSGKLLKEYPKEGYKRAFNQAFTGFPKDVGFNNGLSAPQPDFVEGLRMQEYRPFPVDEYISGAVLYKDDPYSLTLPHLAGEWKGRGEDMDEARLQSAYDGAGLVYARNQALSLIGKPDPPGNAEVTTFTTDGTNLNLFSHYATPSEDGTLEYHQYLVKSTNLIDSHEGLKEGRRGLRNEQDHAKKQSYALRDQLKEHWKQLRGSLIPIAEGAPLPVLNSTEETNADENVASYEVVEQPCQPTPAASSDSRKARSLSPLRLPANNYVPSSSGQKRKASSPSGSSHKHSYKEHIPHSLRLYSIGA